MNEKIAPVKQTSSLRMILTLGGIAAFSGILIATLVQITTPIIKENRKKMLKAAVFEVLPETSSLKVFVYEEGKFSVKNELSDKDIPYYVGYGTGGEIKGVAIPAAGQGFQDIISILYGYSPKYNLIIGMKVLESKETPGLGDKIELDKTFVKNFEALDVQLNPDQSKLLHPIEIVKPGEKTKPWQIDTISGATISSKAIGKILQQSTKSHVPLIKQKFEQIKGAL